MQKIPAHQHRHYHHQVVAGGLIQTFKTKVHWTAYNLCKGELRKQLLSDNSSADSGQSQQHSLVSRFF